MTYSVIYGSDKPAEVITGITLEDHAPHPTSVGRLRAAVTELGIVSGRIGDGVDSGRDAAVPCLYDCGDAVSLAIPLVRGQDVGTGAPISLAVAQVVEFVESLGEFVDRDLVGPALPPAADERRHQRLGGESADRQ